MSRRTDDQAQKEYYKGLILFDLELVDTPELMQEIHRLVEAFIADETRDRRYSDENVRNIIKNGQGKWETAKSLDDEVSVFIPTLESLGWHRSKRFYDLRRGKRTSQ